MRPQRESVLRASKRPRSRRTLPILVLICLVAVVMSVGLVASGTRAKTLEALPVDLSLKNAVISSSPCGNLSTGVSLAAAAIDLGLSPKQSPDLSAPSAILVNADTGKVLFSRKEDERRAIASTTKIMTALLVLEHLALNEDIMASARAEATDESQILLKEGETLSASDLLCALLVGSANDAAVALAEKVAGSVEAFVTLMNKRAEELELTDTHYENPHGLDVDGHYSSAKDLATLTCFAMKDDEFRKVVGTWKCTIPGPAGGPSRSLINHNALLGELDWITGVKTGFTDDAGFCLVASGTRNGVSLISVVLGDTSKDACWQDSKVLLEYGFSQFGQVTVVEKGTPVIEASIPYAVGGKLQLVTEQPLDTSLSGQDEFKLTAKLDGKLHLPIRMGERLGILTLTAGERMLASTALVAEADCPEATLRSKLIYFWQRLVH